MRTLFNKVSNTMLGIYFFVVVPGILTFPIVYFLSGSPKEYFKVRKLQLLSTIIGVGLMLLYGGMTDPNNPTSLEVYLMEMNSTVLIGMLGYVVYSTYLSLVFPNELYKQQF